MHSHQALYATLLIRAHRRQIAELMKSIQELRKQLDTIVASRKIERRPEIDGILTRLGNTNPEAEKADVMVEVKIGENSDGSLNEIRNKIMESGNALSIQTIAPYRYLE